MTDYFIDRDSFLMKIEPSPAIDAFLADLASEKRLPPPDGEGYITIWPVLPAGTGATGRGADPA